MSQMTPPDAIKEDSMEKQKQMISANFHELAQAPQQGRKVVSTFVPGNINELLMCFDMARNLPEINALQNGMRKKTGRMIMEAERSGHSEDVCTYVKADLGMMAQGNIGPTGETLPKPDLLLLSYTGCFTFMKWFELVREQYDCETSMLHIPYQGDGTINENMRDYVVKQLREEVIPTLERVSGVKFDIDRLREYMRESAKSEEDLVWVLQTAKNRPSPIDAYFGGVYYIGPIFTAFRGTEDASEYYRTLRSEIAERLEKGEGPITPDGEMKDEKYRLVVEGPPNWTSFREFWKMFYEEGAVVVASTYTKVGGVYDFGFRHDPDHPLESMADYCLGCYTNLNLPSRAEMLSNYVEDYQADGLLINSIKSCNSFSAGQLLLLREVEKRTGKPGAFIETDLVDPRYFSGANVKNRLESYFQMINQKRGGGFSEGVAA
ncbi:MAG: benzoyl-CoA reductase subunit B [SAR324 cluster bacterium]|jgi:benzoyl-CoA reductase subunit B|nr:benzoyl-CoA reductase subunit B [SAR324 cluster bacterium]MEE1574567.1 benzoyl-CoA reductase subunit B [Deltaproteobacteria bacterium]MDP6246677.1 benzoyl-CoA reductase subunit B [SAR324 cluster bacterium]MDP6462997.1 benzoyl-CoA reductase subunit B [SAR324 cluster bacterium]MDP6728431.1 benzoyl-CoA reductase subunit B [SAR324 cluster bacterium]|tara:strand:+ start:2853 stop:4157 length:1305 start_codon:yes stop_codon:yes gene_type:complete